MGEKRDEELEKEEQSLWDRLPPIIRKMILFSAVVLIFAVTLVLLLKIYELILSPTQAKFVTLITLIGGGAYIYLRRD